MYDLESSAHKVSVQSFIRWSEAGGLALRPRLSPSWLLENRFGQGVQPQRTQ